MNAYTFLLHSSVIGSWWIAGSPVPSPDWGAFPHSLIPPDHGGVELPLPLSSSLKTFWVGDTSVWKRHRKCCPAAPHSPRDRGGRQWRKERCSCSLLPTCPHDLGHPSLGNAWGGSVAPLLPTLPVSYPSRKGGSRGAMLSMLPQTGVTLNLGKAKGRGEYFPTSPLPHCPPSLCSSCFPQTGITPVWERCRGDGMAALPPSPWKISSFPEISIIRNEHLFIPTVFCPAGFHAAVYSVACAGSKRFSSIWLQPKSFLWWCRACHLICHSTEFLWNLNTVWPVCLVSTNIMQKGCYSVASIVHA